MKTIAVPDLKSIDKAAQAFVRLLGPFRIVSVSGEMGAGKTTFIQAICRALGVTQVVSSPTFSLINEYFTHSGDSVYHFDLYRIDDPEELFDIGYEDYMYSGDLCFIEWPEKAPELIPGNALQVKIVVLDDDSRQIIIDGMEN